MKEGEDLGKSKTTDQGKKNRFASRMDKVMNIYQNSNSSRTMSQADSDSYNKSGGSEETKSVDPLDDLDTRLRMGQRTGEKGGETISSAGSSTNNRRRLNSDDASSNYSVIDRNSEYKLSIFKKRPLPPQEDLPAKDLTGAFSATADQTTPEVLPNPAGLPGTPALASAYLHDTDSPDILMTNQANPTAEQVMETSEFRHGIEIDDESIKAAMKSEG